MMMIFPKMLEIHKLTTLGLGNGENPVGKNQSSLGPRVHRNYLGKLWNPPSASKIMKRNMGGPQVHRNLCLGLLSASKIFVGTSQCIENLCLIPSVHRFFLGLGPLKVHRKSLFDTLGTSIFLVWDHQCIENLCLGSPVHRKY